MTSHSVATPSFSVGTLIKDELFRQERTVIWLARKINCDRRNVYNVFERQYIDTELLFRISVALKVDFFAYFSRALTTAGLQEVSGRSVVCAKIFPATGNKCCT